MQQFRQEAETLLELLRTNSMRLALAESCTGGMACAALTDIPGSSDVFERGFVTYSNAAKVELLGVDPDLIKKYGAVSEEVALAMASGALAHSNAQIAASITGIAGPTSDGSKKPVGLVHFAICIDGHSPTSKQARYDNLGRSQVRERAVLDVFELITNAVSTTPI